LKKKKVNIAIIGLGYVGLPLAVEFSKYFNVIAYDKDKKRINELNKNFDRTKELKKKIISKNIKYSFKSSNLKNCNVFIVTVPTPVFRDKKPDLRNLISATKNLSRFLKKGDLVVYESTVYPGCIEEICLPIIKKISNLNLNKDFFLGYSPERIDPGVSKYKLTNQNKIISASNTKGLKIINFIYKKIIKKKLFKVSNIKTAEASKIIENSQRDINIAFMNEIAVIFNKMNINTKEVLKAASSKWNFLKFTPGLVGGHCIGVDPYYLTHKAKQLGIKTKVILSGREINDYIPKYIFFELKKNLPINKKKIKVLMLGLTFKENCPDIRNSKAIELFKFLKKKKLHIDAYDPLADMSVSRNVYKIKLLEKIKYNTYDFIILAVPHKKIMSFGLKKIKKFGKKNCKIFDIKSVFNRKDVFWQL
jgi:UDP-N-acetyl-D-galactosamine dehydrogenase